MTQGGTQAALRDRIDALGRETPSFAPWLGVVRVAIDAIDDPAWARSAEEISRPGSDGEGEGGPALANAIVPVDARATAALLERLLLAAAAAPGDGARGLRGAAGSGRLQPVAILAAAVRQDRAALNEMARAAGVSAEAFLPVAELCALPLLQRCGRLLAARAKGWSEGHCPVCGAWPALAELRGLDRTRRSRCARCGVDRESTPLACVYCSNHDHDRLSSLVPESGGDSKRVETCGVCKGFLKTLARLKAIAPEMVLLEDLATVELDLVALERGFRRPDPAGALRTTRVEAREGRS